VAADHRVSVLSLEYVRAPVRALKNGVPFDPTGDTVQLAFLPTGSSPTSGDWKTSSWEVGAAGTQSATYFARCLVGPGGAITLALGVYVVWVKVTDAPEVPVLQAGTLEIY
jgi:hypothetical protein